VPGGYRNNLYADLTASGYAVQFVGSVTANPSPLLASTGNAAQEGHSGYRISDLTANVDTWFASVQPDLVVLMIGTNDVNTDFWLSYAPARLGALLDAIELLDPNGRILLSTIPWTLDANLNVAVAAYNSSMPAVAAAHPGVWFFDNTSVLDVATDYSDTLHPNQQGYNKLGDALAAEAEQILAPEPRSLPITGVALLLATVSLRMRTRRRC
jgi:lysophospholipase L1-like esterase